MCCLPLCSPRKGALQIKKKTYLLYKNQKKGILNSYFLNFTLGTQLPQLLYLSVKFSKLNCFRFQKRYWEKEWLMTNHAFLFSHKGQASELITNPELPKSYISLFSHVFYGIFGSSVDIEVTQGRLSDISIILILFLVSPLGLIGRN